jgi:hypothetical protein
MAAHHRVRVPWSNNPHTLNPIIKETEVKLNQTATTCMLRTFSKKRKTKISFWNVRILKESRKLKQLAKEMEEYRLNILELGEER